MKKLLTLLLFFTSIIFADAQMLEATPYSEVQLMIGKEKPVFLEIGSDHCHSCQEMGKILFKIKKEHPTYNLNFINIAKERDVAMKLKVMMIPTQIIFNAKGKEVFRHIGKLEQDDLDKVLKKYKFLKKSNI